MNLSIIDMIIMSNLGSHLKKLKNLKSIVMWLPPPKGMVKFNVDGASRGYPDEVGIGGALKDEGGKLLI